MDVLEQAIGTPNAKNVALQLRPAIQSLREGLDEIRKSGNPNEDISADDDDDDDEDDASEAVHKQLSKKGLTGTAKEVAMAVLPWLDPPPFENALQSLDIARGILLCKYRQAKQIWVPRGSTARQGLLDMVHIPAVRDSASSEPNDKVAIYCNPNAGLYEVVAGIGFLGGNVGAHESTKGDSWIDFYTGQGYDVYMFNYAGYGRSRGGAWFTGAAAARGSGMLARLLRIVGNFVGFAPSPSTLRHDAHTIVQHVLTFHGKPSHIVLHGESIGGVAASRAARLISPTQNVTFVGDRTLGSLPAVAQRLVGSWTGPAIRLLAPLWDTNVTADALLLGPNAILATDAGDQIIHDAASVKSTVAQAHEFNLYGKSAYIGDVVEEPLEYRMAMYLKTDVSQSRFAKQRPFPPLVPKLANQSRISLEQVQHFAACCKRIAVVSAQYRNDAVQKGELNDLRLNVPGETNGVIEAWSSLSCCDGLSGSPLGVAIKRDTTIAWVCSCLIFGAQQIEADGQLLYDQRPSNWKAVEAQTGQYYPKPIPEVIRELEELEKTQQYDESIEAIAHEVSYTLSLLRYMCDRHRKALDQPASSISQFLNLTCGHNCAYSNKEKDSLQKLLAKALSTYESTSSLKRTPLEIV